MEGSLLRIERARCSLALARSLAGTHLADVQPLFSNRSGDKHVDLAAFEVLQHALLRDFGAAMSPANAFQLLQGVETLPLRMARHVENARAVTEMLEANDAVAWVKYPTASDHPDRALAAELYPNGTGAILSFGVKGGRAAGKAFIESVKLASHLANVGDAKTLVLHPASTTHAQLSDDELEVVARALAAARARALRNDHGAALPRRDDLGR